MDEQPETPFASDDKIPAGYSATAGTAGIQTTLFSLGPRSIPIDGPDSDRAPGYSSPDITSTTDSEVIHLNQKAANASRLGGAAQHASMLGTQPESSTGRNPSGVQLSSTPLLGGPGTVSTQPVTNGSDYQQQQGKADSSLLVGSSSQFARYSEPSTADSDRSAGQGRGVTGSAEQPLAEERSLRSIYSLGICLTFGSHCRH